jgi:hypothetical protein
VGIRGKRHTANADKKRRLSAAFDKKKEGSSIGELPVCPLLFYKKQMRQAAPAFFYICGFPQEKNRSLFSQASGL